MPGSAARTALITGCSSGIGRATAKHFSDRGWNVVATMRDPAPADELGALPGVLVEMLDVTEPETIRDTLAAALERFERIDVLVNNAGYGQYGVFEAASDEAIRRQFDVNVFGVMNVMRALLPHFRAHGGGTIVNVSSGAGVFTLPQISLYAASKFALEGFSEAVAYELAAVGIAVKIVEPHGGVSATEFNTTSLRSFARDPAVADAYRAFETATAQAFGKMVAAVSQNASDVAAVIFDAATDGTSRLRYPAGNDTRGFMRARRPRGDDAYVEYMRAFFRESAPGGESLAD